jgi:hypothetical protein
MSIAMQRADKATRNPVANVDKYQAGTTTLRDNGIQTVQEMQ